MRLQSSSQTEFDAALPGLLFNPHPVLHRMRAEAPVQYSEQLSSWVLTRYDDVSAAFRDARLSVVEETKRIEALPSEDQAALLPLRRIFEAWGGRAKVEDHARFLKLLKPRFTPSNMRQRLPRIQEIMNALLEAALAKGELDVVNDIAHPLAMSIVAELTGVPSDRMDLLLRCSNAISGLLEMGEREQLFACQAGMLELCDYLTPIVASHRAQPSSTLIGVMLEAQGSGALQDDADLAAQCIMFLVVGYHTTANLLSSGVQLLLEHPEQRQKLEHKPELTANAFDEMMRYHGPVASVRRLALEDLTVRGVSIPAGDTLVLALAAANRDPAVFSEPDTFYIERPGAKQQIGFTTGAYSCMGQALARLEGDVFFRTLLARLPKLRARDAEPDWVGFRPLGRELRSLRVLFD
jgi:cytochrome P450